MEDLGLKIKSGENSMPNLFDKIKNVVGVGKKEPKIHIKDHVTEFDVKLDEIEKFNFGTSTRVVVINNCNTIQQLLEIINGEVFRKFIKASTHCFVIVANLLKLGSILYEDFPYHFESGDLIGRPIIIQLNIQSSSRTFFKDSGDDQVQEIFDESAENNVFAKLLGLLIDSNSEENFLTWEIKKKAKIDNVGLLEYAVKKNDSLTVRFLKLFCNWTINNTFLEDAVKVTSLETFRALLDLPILDDGKEIRLDEATTKSLSESKKLLCLAAEYGSPEIVECLLRLRLFTESFEDALIAVNSAFTSDRFENLLLLVSKDLPFPGGFSNIFERDDCKNQKISDLKEVFRSRTVFHDAIMNHDRPTLENFIENNPDIKIAFNPSNKPALLTAIETAIETKNFSIFAFLLYHRFTANDDLTFQNLYNSLGLEEKEKVTLECKKFYGRPVDSHIFFIYSKTRLGFGYDKSQQNIYFESIKRYLDKLNLIPEIVPIMKLIEFSYTLIIVFDFDHDNVHKIDLTSSPRTSGMCYPVSGRIYIGAKTAEEEVVSTLIHELTHYAMKILYNNHGKPYQVDDHVNEQLFDEIIEECRMIEPSIRIVERVFTCYDSPAFSAELIVRAPEMMSFYHAHPKLLAKHMKIYSSLFQYYNNKVFQDAENFIKDPVEFESTRDVQQLNDRLGNLKEFGDIKLKLQFHMGSDNPKHQVIQNTSRVEIIKSQVPQFTISKLLHKEKLIRQGRDVRGSVVVLSSRDVKNELIFQNILSVCLVNLAVTLILYLKNSRKLPDEITTLINTGKSCPKKLFIVCDEKCSDEVFGSNLIDCIQTIDTFSWDDLDDELQTKLLATEVKFQGHTVKLNEIVKKHSPSAKFLPLDDLVEEKFTLTSHSIKISLGYDSRYFIDRSFYKETSSNIAENFNNFISDSQQHKVMLISDDAGMGKSTIMSHIALKLKRLHPDHWVIRVDLHQLTDMFNELDESEHDDRLALIVDNLVKIETKFERQLFLDLLNSGKVILLLDGLDEIFPFNEESFSEFFEEIHSSPVKQIWLTMRPHLEESLISYIDNNLWHLKPFTIDDQTKFLVKYWKSQLKIHVDDTSSLNSFASKLIELIADSLDDDSHDLIGIPLQTQMLASIFYDNVRHGLKSGVMEIPLTEKIDLLWLYQQFMARKIRITESEKGETVGFKEAKNVVEGVDIMEIHEKLAVRQLRPEGFETENYQPDPDLLDIDISDDELQRIGIISIDSHNKPHFIHQTFAEYFVARFIHMTLQKSKSDFIPIALMLLSSKKGISSIIKVFIESSIAKSKKVQDNEKIHIKVAKCIEKKLKLDEFEFIPNFLKHNHLHTVNFFLNCASHCGDEVIVKIITSVEDENLLHVSVAKGNKTLVDKVWSLAERAMTPETLKEFYLQKDCNGTAAFIISYHKICFSEVELADECNGIVGQVDYEFYSKNSILSKLLGIAKQLLDESECEELVDEKYERHYYQFDGRETVYSNGKIGPNTKSVYARKPIEASFSEKFFQKILDHRWELNKSMSKTPDKKIMTGRNLFINFCKFVITQTREGDHDAHVLELYKWIQKKFPDEEIMKFCLTKFGDKATIRMFNVQNAKKVLKIMKTFMSAEHFLNFLQFEATLLTKNPYDLEFHIPKMIGILSKVMSVEEFMCVILNKHNYYDQNVLVRQILDEYLPLNDLKLTLDIFDETFSNKQIIEIYEKSKDEISDHKKEPEILEKVNFLNQYIERKKIGC